MEKEAQFAQLDKTAFSQIRAWETKLSRELGTPIMLVAYEEKHPLCPGEEEPDD